MRIVLDTNVLISGLISKTASPFALHQALLAKRFVLVTSAAQLCELSRVLKYDKFRPYVHEDEVSDLLNMIGARAVVVNDLPEVNLSLDPDDNVILATAIAGQADLIVSGDKRHLLGLGEVEGIPIVTARAALDRIEAEQ